MIFETASKLVNAAERNHTMIWSPAAAQLLTDRVTCTWRASNWNERGVWAIYIRKLTITWNCQVKYDKWPWARSGPEVQDLTHRFSRNGCRPARWMINPSVGNTISKTKMSETIIWTKTILSNGIETLKSQIKTLKLWNHNWRSELIIDCSIHAKKKLSSQLWVPRPHLIQQFNLRCTHGIPDSWDQSLLSW